MSGSKTTDTHGIQQKLVPGTGAAGAGGVHIYGPHIFSVFNRVTGEEVERVEGFGAALAAQAKWDAYVKANGNKG